MTDYADLIGAASRRYGLPPEYIRAVMAAESDNVPTATSHAGAMGLMQVMPGTYAELRGRYPELGEDPYDPQNSINAGTAYLREMHDRYGAPGFLAAYNAGPGRYDEYLNAGRPLPAETTRYVDTIYPQIEGIPMSGPQRLPPVPEVILGPVIGANAGIAPPLNPAGLPMTALDVPPDPRAPGPPMTPSAMTVDAPPAQGGVAEFLQANPMALIGLGAGLLSAAGPSPTPQNAFGPAMQGFMSGMQMDQEMADRALQQQQQAALQQAIAGAGLDPTMAALAQQFPEMFAQQMFAGMGGGGGLFEGTSMDAQAANIYRELTALRASGQPLTPQQEFDLALAERQLMMPRVVGTPDTGFTEVGRPRLPDFPGAAVAPVPAAPGAGIAGAPPAVAPTVSEGPVVAGGDGSMIRPLTEGEPADRFVGSEVAGRLAMLDTVRTDLENVTGMLFPAGLDGPIDSELQMLMGTPGLNRLPGAAREANQMIQRTVEAVLRAQTGAAAPEQEIRRYMDMFGVGLLDTEEGVRNKLRALERFINHVRGNITAPVDGDIPPLDLDAFAPEAPAGSGEGAEDLYDRFGLER